MNITTCLLFLTALLTLTKASITTTADVLVLDENNFEEEVDLHHIILVKFYAPW
jgi:hypothetical protein